MRLNSGSRGHVIPRENSTSPTSPPPGYSTAQGFAHPPHNEADEVQYANMIGREPPPVPSPPANYAVAHSYGPSANSSFSGKRPGPPQPMPRTCPRQGPRSSPSTEGSEGSYPGHYGPQSPLHDGSYHAHSPQNRGLDYNAAPTGGAKHIIPSKGFILPLSDRMSPRVEGGEEEDSVSMDNEKSIPSPGESLSDASHMGRYSPSQNNSSPPSTGARSSPVSHDHYSRSHDSSDEGSYDEELPCINPYAIMDMDRSGAAIQPYTVTDIPRLTDYPPSEHSS